VRKRVCAARTVQQTRFEGRPIFCNAQMGAREIKEFCPVANDVKTVLRAAIQQLGLSARAYDRILKVSRTIADLSGAPEIGVPHVAEAIQYRSLDRKMWT
jgi:magnesium chelatase family protein